MLNVKRRFSVLIVAVLLLGMASCGRKPVKEEVVSDTVQDESAPESELPEAVPAERPPGQAPPVLFHAPDFKLVDQTGKPFGTEELRGQAWIANFMFTKCTATCPQQTAKLAELQQFASRWPDRDRVRLVSVTVDPEHDTVAKLNEYAELNHADPERWKFLTGARAELFELSKKGFKLPVADAAADASTPLMHSSKFILVDRKMQVRGFYDSQADKDVLQMLHDLRTVLAESTPDSKSPLHMGMPANIFFPTWLEPRKAAQLKTAGEIGVYHDFAFEDRVEASGIQFVSRVVPDAGRDFKINHYDHGNGLAVADVDNDGLLDLYFVSQVGGNELWRNLGEGRFENVTEKAGVALPGRVCVTASFADADNDGDPDLFVTTTRYGNAFFENDGKGVFRDVTKAAGLEYTGHSSSADFFDYDRDGKLDLFLTNVGRFTTDQVGYSGDPEKKEDPYYVGLKDAFSAHLVLDRSERSILYHNDGGNRFHDASAEVGLNHTSWSGESTPLDVNEDGWIDLFVANMQGSDEYYENVAGKQFKRRSPEVFPTAMWGGMGIKSFDYNNDGHQDLFVTNMHSDMWWYEGLGGADEKQKAPAEKVPPETFLRSRSPGKGIFGNAFYENQGKSSFQEVSNRINAENYWPWGPSAGDLNADGYQDLFITSSMNLTFRYQVNSLLLNDRGQKFRDAEFILGVEPRRGGQTAAPWFELDCSGKDAKHRLAEGRTGKLIVWGALGSRSSALIDLEGDGDLDIVTNDSNSPPMVLISNLAERNPKLSWLKLQLRGTASNKDGLGATVQVKVGDRVLTQFHDGQSGYLSQSSVPLYFGLGDAQDVDEIAIQWLGGSKQVLRGPIKKNQLLFVTQE